MGTEFFWFYDLILIGVFFGFTFRCLKKGFVSSIAGLLSLLIAFIVAFALTNIIANVVYEQWIKHSARDIIEENIELQSDKNYFQSFSVINPREIIIDGEKASDMSIKFDPTGKTTLDLKNVDFSNTGLKEMDLEIFGVSAEQFDVTNTNLGKIVINASDLENSTFEELVFAKAVIRLYQVSGNSEIITAIDDAISLFSENIMLIENNGSDLLAMAVIKLVQSNQTTLSDALVDDIIKPIIMVPLKSLVFFLLFALVSFILRFITRALESINRVPIVGPVNTFFGAVVGLLESAVVIFLVSIFLHIITTITGNTIIFLNDLTINSTYLFKYVYNFDLINLFI